MAFTFDPKATLAARQNGTGGLATDATVATETREPGSLVAVVATVAAGDTLAASGDAITGEGGARIVEQGTGQTAGHDRAAKVASEAARLSQGSCANAATSDTPSGVVADLDAFEERAAIAEYDAGLPRAEAEQLAAEAQGFTTPEALHAALTEGWRRNLETLARHETSPRRRACIAAALRFIADGWAAKAAALGWPEVELFGADPGAPWDRRDRLGAAYSDFMPGAVTAEAIVYPGSGARPMHRWRASQAEGGILPWEGRHH